MMEREPQDLDLRSLQVGLLELIKGRQTADDRPYLSTVALSAGLQICREVAAFWRTASLERNVPLTTALFKARGELADVVLSLSQAPDLSPFHVDLRDRFLSAAAASNDPLVAAIARFEQALLALGESNQGAAVVASAGPRPNGYDWPVVVDWPVDPYPVLAALARGSLDIESVSDMRSTPHRVVVGPNMAGGFSVVAV
jgi:hypothetical protein